VETLLVVFNVTLTEQFGKLVDIPYSLVSSFFIKHHNSLPLRICLVSYQDECIEVEEEGEMLVPEALITNPASLLKCFQYVGELYEEKIEMTLEYMS